MIDEIDAEDHQEENERPPYEAPHPDDIRCEPTKGAAQATTSGAARTNTSAAMMNPQSPTVRPIATTRRFHQDRHSLTSQARFSASIIATIAAELLQMAPRMPKVSSDPCFPSLSSAICARSKSSSS